MIMVRINNIFKQLAFYVLFVSFFFSSASLTFASSITPEFERLMGIDIKTKAKPGKRGFVLKQRVKIKSARNKMPYRDFDTENLKNYYKKHLEEFKKNPNYAKAFPSYNEYFKTKYNEELVSEIPETNVITKRDNNYINMSLDPSLLYRVDYLLASKGKGASSGFGHSMMRLVFCDPSKVIRKGIITLDESCLDHHNFHVVITYRANISEIQTSLLKGIFGGYKSRLFLVPFNEIKNEYNDFELRDLIAYKIDLTAELKRRLVYRTLENYWTYRNDYYFVSNNCATETASLIDTILWDKKTRVNTNETPYGLVDELKSKNLISHHPIIYPSYKDKYSSYIDKINEILNKEITLNEFEGLNPDERLILYTDIISNESYLVMDFAKKRKLLSSLRLLEKRVLNKNDHKVMDNFEKLLQSGTFNENDIDSILSIGEITDNMNIVGDSSVGIPITISENQISTFEKNLKVYAENLNALYKTLYEEAPDLTELKESIERNLDYLSSNINIAKEIQ